MGLGITSCWVLKRHMYVVPTPQATSTSAFWSGCGRSRRPLAKRLRRSGRKGPSPCSNRPGFSWACSATGRKCSKALVRDVRRPQIVKILFTLGDRSALSYDFLAPIPSPAQYPDTATMVSRFVTRVRIKHNEVENNNGPSYAGQLLRIVYDCGTSTYHRMVQVCSWTTH